MPPLALLLICAALSRLQNTHTHTLAVLHRHVAWVGMWHGWGVVPPGHDKCTAHHRNTDAGFPPAPVMLPAPRPSTSGRPPVAPQRLLEADTQDGWLDAVDAYWSSIAQLGSGAPNDTGLPYTDGSDSCGWLPVASSTRCHAVSRGCQ